MGLLRVVQVLQNYSERLPKASLGPHLARAHHTAATPTLLMLWVLRQACSGGASLSEAWSFNSVMLGINAKTKRSAWLMPLLLIWCGGEREISAPPQKKNVVHENMIEPSGAVEQSALSLHLNWLLTAGSPGNRRCLLAEGLACRATSHTQTYPQDQTTSLQHPCQVATRWTVPGMRWLRPASEACTLF